MFDAVACVASFDVQQRPDRGQTDRKDAYEGGAWADQCLLSHHAPPQKEA